MWRKSPTYGEKPHLAGYAYNSMFREVLILDPPGHSVGDLRAALAALLPESCPVELIDAFRSLGQRLESSSGIRLVIIHAERGDGAGNGLTLVKQLREQWADLLIVAVADEGSVWTAAEAIAAGANDFLVRGEQLAERTATLLSKLQGLVSLIEATEALHQRNADLQEEMQARYHIVGQSPQILQLIARIERVAHVPRPLLITGERGTGKELVARAVHSVAGDAQRPIVTVNCAAFSDALLESELFGHERGAFTGADETRIGKFELADRGTLFLDEIAHMSLAFQQKILRIVEYGTFSRVGGRRELVTNVRVIAATNADLKSHIRGGRFLSDLYDRLAFEVIEVPPLRERQGDVEVLARHFLNQFAREIPAFRGKSLAASSLRLLNRYSFPGNVRELKNIIERAAYRDTTNEITPEDIGMLAEESAHLAKGSFHQRVDAYRRRLIADSLRRAKGNQSTAARLLGLSYHQYRYYLRKYRANTPDER